MFDLNFELTEVVDKNFTALNSTYNKEMINKEPKNHKEEGRVHGKESSDK